MVLLQGFFLSVCQSQTDSKKGTLVIIGTMYTPIQARQWHRFIIFFLDRTARIRQKAALLSGNPAIICQLGYLTLDCGRKKILTAPIGWSIVSYRACNG